LAARLGTALTSDAAVSRSQQTKLERERRAALEWVRSSEGRAFGAAVRRQSISDFRDRYARGGYRWTMVVNQYLGAAIATRAILLGIGPAHLSLLHLAIGVATSAWILLLHTSAPLLAASVGVIGWQLAYSLDCADGQVARATGRSSPGGAILDLLSDYLVQITVIFSMLQVATPGMIPTWSSGFSVFVTGGWLISPFYGAIVGVNEEALGPGRVAPLRDLVTQARDYGIHVAVLPVAMLVGTAAVTAILSVIASLNFVALLLGIDLHGRPRRAQSGQLGALAGERGSRSRRARTRVSRRPPRTDS
jgi:phosphatidylglycerophosphate synthase